MAKLLEGKVALVTGAGRGIGREIAILMASEGAKVIVNDLGGNEKGEEESASKAPAMEVVHAIREAGGEAAANFGSVADRKDAKAMVEQAVDTFGKIDCVVNNAGILRDVIFHRMTPEEWDIVINVHLNGSFNTSHFAAPHFKAQGSGVFVHFTSTSGLIGNFGQANYSAAKMGIIGLSKSLALDMQRFGVSSNCVAPFAWSRLVGTIPINSEADAQRIEKAKQSTPAKIAPLVAGLATEEGRKITGQIFGVRRNEMYLFSQNRPIRSVHTAEGWTPTSVVETALPAFAGSAYPLDRSSDIFTWDPI
ncbi:MAG: SDR family NAD(P)-dependent oxidoreductase [Pseudomonadota bacterium]|nr:SDR family NAD(P)-dependent oxidoreductase [Pseudomonadota bacterium]